MNERDYLWVEDRCYGDHRAMDAARRLHDQGEAQLAERLTRINMAHADALAEFRRALRDHQIEARKQ